MAEAESLRRQEEDNRRVEAERKLKEEQEAERAAMA